MQGNYAWIEEEGDFESVRGFEKAHEVGTTVGGFMAG